MPDKSQCPPLCPGRYWGKLRMEAEGNGTSGVMLMGEALGEREEYTQLPFRPDAEAGSLLTRALRMAGIPRQSLTIVNAVWCRPPNNKLDGQDYETEAVSWCRHYNRAVIEARKPRVIVALGNVALRALTNFSGVAREKQSVSYLRGWVVPSAFYTKSGGEVVFGDSNDDPMLIIPTYHPSFIQRGAKHLLGVLIHDFRLAVHLAASSLRAPLHTSYNLIPTEKEAEEFLSATSGAPEYPVSFDIETDQEALDEDENVPGAGRIISIQFSFRQYTAIQMPWAGGFIDIAKAVLALPNPKLGCNSWQFDEPVLAGHGVEIKGEHHDLRWAFHALYPDLPANLQYISSFASTHMRVLTQNNYAADFYAERPWKHTSGILGSDYGCKDVDWPLRVWPDLVAELKERGAWPAYERYTRQLRPLLLRQTHRGMLVDDNLRLGVGARVESAKLSLSGKLQPLIPERLLPVLPKNGYKVQYTPDQAKQLIPLKSGEKLALCGFNGIERWCRLQPFNADSPYQVMNYIKLMGHRIPRGMEGTGKDVLRALARSTHDPVYKLVQDIREVGEMLDTHVKGWVPGSDSRVHPHFTFTPATGQIACYGPPNALNAPKAKGQAAKDELAKDFRAMVKPAPGCRLWEFDLQSAHSVTMGWEAKDADWIRLAKADIHSYLTAHLVGQKDAGVKKAAEECLSYSDADLRSFLAGIKRDYKDIRNGQAKNAILGYGFGMGWRRLYNTYGEYFAREADAKRVHEMLTALFPKAAQWRDDVRRLAHRQTFLLSRFGCLRWFFDVFHWNWKTCKNVPGEHSEAAIAFLPANDAFCYIKEAMLDLDGPDAWLDRMGLVLYYHDALLLEMPRQFEDDAVPRIKAHMSRPCPQLDGLSLGVSVACGDDWGHLEEVKA